MTKMTKVFCIRKGAILFKEKVEFGSVFEELIWKVRMKAKGCRVTLVK